MVTVWSELLRIASPLLRSWVQGVPLNVVVEAARNGFDCVAASVDR